MHDFSINMMVCVISLPHLLPKSAKVVDLILSGPPWNHHLIDNIFHPEEAQKIKLIPLSWSHIEDKIWSMHGTSLFQQGYKGTLKANGELFAGSRLIYEHRCWLVKH
ncbi:hypothetical protein VNO77_17223 [Canavalia gladiata]|uniref:Uncharacterized protein n=1 Tax=Canavalia gladiata TaxID=3824 RepID=A0AAN9QIK2_CANGL